MRTYWLRLLMFSLILGTIPVFIIGMISYHIAGNDIENRVKEGNMHILLQTQMRIEQLFNMLEKSVLQFTSTPLIKNALGESWTVRDFAKVNNISTGLLNLQTSVPVHQAYFVNLEKDWLVGFTEFKPVHDFKYASMFRSYAEDTKSLFVETDFTGARVKPAGDSQTVSFVQKIPIVPNLKIPRGLLVVDILQEDILKLLRQSEEFGFFYILDRSGNFFMGNEREKQEYSPINRLVAEKVEQGQVQGTFHSKVNKHQVIVAYLTSQSNGWIYVSATSVSEVTKQTGKIAIITFIVCASIILIVLVIAFYGSLRMYRPIRSLLELVKQTGADNEGNSGSNELSFIEKGVQDLWQSRSQLQQQLRGQLRYVKEYLVIKLLVGQTTGNLMEREARIYGFPENWHQVVVMTVQIDTLHQTRYQEHDKGLLLFAINNMVGELLEPATRFDPILFDQSQVTLVTVENIPEPEQKERLYLLGEKIQREVMKYLQLQISIGISRPFSSLSDTVRAYGESLLALKSRISLGYGIIVHYDDFANRGDHETVMYSHLNVLEDRIVLSLKNNHEETLKENFNVYLDALFENESFMSDHVVVLLQLMVKILALVRDQGTKVSRLFDGDQHIKELCELNSREDIAAWFQERLFDPVSSLLSHQEESQYTVISSQMKQIIHEGFLSDLSLDSCAKLLNYHPVYLSRVFKKHVGIGFSDYLNNCRIDWAKDTLERTDAKISDIGQQLQYKNTSAFIRSFRKSTGMTPGQYRDSKEKG